MKSASRLYWVAGILLVIGMAIEVARPKPLDWTPTYSRSKTTPYASKAVYDLLEEHVKPSKLKTDRRTFYERYSTKRSVETESKRELSILIADHFTMEDQSHAQLMRYVSDGNVVFIASHFLPAKLRDTLKLGYYHEWKVKPDSVYTLHFTNPSFPKKVFTVKNRLQDGSFAEIDTANATVLCTDSAEVGRATFLRYQFGAGELYISSTPTCFTNYNIGKNDNAEITERVLSHLFDGKDFSRVVWDEFYQEGRGVSQTPLRVIYSSPELKLAFFIMLGMLILLALFGAKRRQSIIPLIEQNTNTTVEFVTTLGQLYFQRHDNNGLLLKKLRKFFDYVRNKLGENPYDVYDSAYINRVAMKTGIDDQFLQQLFRDVKSVLSYTSIPDEYLLQISYELDEFYSRTKR